MNKVFAYPTYAAAAMSAQTFGSAESRNLEPAECGRHVISPYVCRFEHELSFVPVPPATVLEFEPSVAIYQRFSDADSAGYQLDQPVIELLGFQSFQRILASDGYSFRTRFSPKPFCLALSSQAVCPNALTA